MDHSPEVEAQRNEDAIVETDEQLIERLLAKAETDHKCCGSHCSNVACAGEAG